MRGVKRTRPSSRRGGGVGMSEDPCNGCGGRLVELGEERTATRTPEGSTRERTVGRCEGCGFYWVITHTVQRAPSAATEARLRAVARDRGRR